MVFDDFYVNCSTYGLCCLQGMGKKKKEIGSKRFATSIKKFYIAVLYYGREDIEMD